MTITAPDHGMLAELPEDQRRVLHLRLVQGLSAARTAEVLGSERIAVLLIQHRALNALRGRLSGM